jgi:4a-hydroxytetrahydrobiopterin dehydratase
MATLTDDEIRAALADLPGWELGEGEIVKELRFDTFRNAIAFINRIADQADATDHHPELTNVYTRVRVAYSTHSEGGVTTKDIDAAHAVEALTKG